METLLGIKNLAKGAYGTGYDAYKIYCAVYAHFNANYDIVTFGIYSPSISYDAYLKRNDMHFFESIASKYNQKDMLSLFISNALGGEFNVVNMTTIEGMDCFIEFEKRLFSIKQHYINDCVALFTLTTGSNKNFSSAFKGSQYPLLLKLLIQKYISPESVLLLNSFLKVFDFMDESCGDNELWIKWKIKLDRYSLLLDLNTIQAKEIFCQVKKSFK